MEFNYDQKAPREEVNMTHIDENCDVCVSQRAAENYDDSVVTNNTDEKAKVDSVGLKNMDENYISIEENDYVDDLGKCRDIDAPDETNSVKVVERSIPIPQDGTVKEVETTVFDSCFDTKIVIGLEPSMSNVCDTVNCSSGFETRVLDACDDTKEVECYEDTNSVKDIVIAKLNDTKLELVCDYTSNTVHNSCDKTSYKLPHKVTEDSESDKQEAEIIDKSKEGVNNMIESSTEKDHELSDCKSTIPDQLCTSDLDIYNTAECEASSTLGSSVIEDLKKLKTEINSLPFVKTNYTDQPIPQENSSVIFSDRNKFVDEQDDADLDRSISDEPYGLNILFNEDISKQSKNVKVKGERSKAARKRKAQQQRLVNLLAPTKTKPSRRFAQSFKELVRSPAERENMELESSLICPVCLEMYHLPHACYPCSHMFCDPCLRRLTSKGVADIPCPLCRTTIQACHIDRDFDEHLLLTHPDIYTERAMLERKTKFRHYKLPFTPPVPLGRQLLRHLVAARGNQNTRWLSQDLFKFMAGCLFGVCVSMFIVRFSSVNYMDNAQYINIVFVSLVCGAGVTYLAFKLFKI